MNATSLIAGKGIVRIAVFAAIATLVVCAMFAFAPKAYAVDGLVAAAPSATGENGSSLSAQGMKSHLAAKAARVSQRVTAKGKSSKYGLLMKDGNIYPCNSKGKRISKRWSSAAWRGTSPITKLFVASNVKTVPDNPSYWIDYSAIPDVQYSMSLAGCLRNAKSVTFLLKSGKSSVKSLPDFAFSRLEYLKSVKNFNKTKLTKISKYAFEGSQITSIALPTTLRSIGDYAFKDSQLLKKVAGLNKTKVKVVGKGAFQDCISLTGVSLPKTCVTIDDYAFGGCTALTKIVFGSKVKTLGTNAFSGCAKLASVDLPKSVRTMGYQVFADCASLAKVTMNAPVVVQGETASASMTGTFANTKIEAKKKKKGAYIYVPESLLEKYSSSEIANPWRAYSKRFRAIPTAEAVA